MKIRSVAGTGAACSAENTFIAVDDLENRLGQCSVERTIQEELAPERPCQVRLSAEGDDGAMMQLLGTALTRGMMLARESGVNARVYAECAPGDEKRMELYRTLGLMDDDALVCMSRKIVSGPKVARLPEGCAFVEDDLRDGQERAFFLDRQAKLFQRENAAHWLEGICKKPMMRRLLLVSREGLAGEAILWAEDGAGRIDAVYTAPAWRRRGVASYLLEAARQTFYQCRLPESRVEVRLSMKPMVALAATAGYRQEKVLCRLPGLNLDAPVRGGSRFR